MRFVADRQKEAAMQGYIHSLESFGTVDGPGIRYVVFFQGCPMRCLYCHNPDTWKKEDGKQMDAEEILANFERNKSFYRTGGITASGGEPLLQIDFLTELFTKAKQRNIHTCLDTSGIVYDKVNTELMAKFDALFAVTDLVMLDIKHMENEAHKKLTGHSNASVFDFAEALKQAGIPIWIRHVVVPEITYDREELTQLGQYLRTLPNLEKLEVLPYHTMGKAKYEALNIPYPLGDTPQLTKAEAAEAKKIIETAQGI